MVDENTKQNQNDAIAAVGNSTKGSQALDSVSKVLTSKKEGQVDIFSI